MNLNLQCKEETTGTSDAESCSAQMVHASLQTEKVVIMSPFLA